MILEPRVFFVYDLEELIKDPRLLGDHLRSRLRTGNEDGTCGAWGALRGIPSHTRGADHDADIG